MGPISGAYQTAQRLWARALGGGERCAREVEMADAEEGVAEAVDITTGQSLTPTRNATPAPSASGTAIALGAGTEPKNGMGVPPPPNV